MYQPRHGARFHRQRDEAESWTSTAPFKCLPSLGHEVLLGVPESDLDENGSSSRFIRDIRHDGSQVWSIGACNRCSPDAKKLDWGGLCAWRPIQRLTLDGSETLPLVFPSIPLSSLMNSTNIENLLYIQDSPSERNKLTLEIGALINAIKVTHIVQTKDLWSRVGRAIQSTLGGILYHPGQLESLNMSMTVGHPFVFAMSDASRIEDMALVNVILAQNGLPLARPVLDSVQDYATCPEAVLQLSSLTEDLNEIVEMTAFQTYLEGGNHLIVRCLNHRGALSHRKFQMWDHCIDGVEMGALEEVMLVPVGVSWETEGVARRAKVVFEQPMSLMELCKGFSQIHPKESENRLERVRFIAHHVLSTVHLIEHAQPSHILNALGALFFQEEATEVSVKDHFCELTDKVQSKKLDLAFSGKVQDILNIYEAKTCRSKPDLAVNVVRLFAPESVLSLIVISLQPSSLTLPQWIGVNQPCAPRISKSKLIAGCQFLWRIVPPRLVCVAPCHDLTLLFHETLESMVIEEILHIEQEHDGSHLLDRFSKTMARNLDLDEDDGDQDLNVEQRLKQVQVVPTAKAIWTLFRYAEILKAHFENICYFLEMARIEPYQVNYEEQNANHPLTLGEFADLGICLENIGMASKNSDGSIALTEDWRNDVSGMADYYNLLRLFLCK